MRRCNLVSRKSPLFGSCQRTRPRINGQAIPTLVEKRQTLHFQHASSFPIKPCRTSPILCHRIATTAIHFSTQTGERQHQQHQQHQQHHSDKIESSQTFEEIKHETSDLINISCHPIGSLPHSSALQAISKIHDASLLLEPSHSPVLTRSYALLATQLLFRLLSEHEVVSSVSQREIFLNTAPIHLTLECWKHSSACESGERSKEILERWTDTFGADFVLQPSTEGFLLILECFASSFAPHRLGDDPMDRARSAWENAEASGEILEYMKELHSLGNMYVRPDESCVGSVIVAWSHAASAATYASREGNDEWVSKRDEALRNAQSLLDRYDASKGTAPMHFSPHNAIIVALLMDSNSWEAVEKAQQILEKIMNDDNISLLDRDATMFGNAFIEVMKRNPARAEKVESLLLNLLSWNKKGSSDMRHFWEVISSYCLGNHDDRMEEQDVLNKIQSLLQLMEETLLSDTADTSGFQGKMYLNLIRALTTSTSVNQINNTKTAGFKAEILLLHLLRLCEQNANVVLPTPVQMNEAVNHILAHHLTQNQPGRVESLFLKISESPSDIVQPNTTSYIFLLRSLARSGLAQRAHTYLNRMEGETNTTYARPNGVAYTEVIRGYGDRGLAEQAESVMRQMEQRYQQTNDPNLQPDAHIYATVIKAWAKKGNGERAHAILKRILDSPTLNHSEHRSNSNSKTVLNKFVYSGVIDAYAKSRQAEKAQSILELMEERYNRTGDESIRPDAVCYTSVLNAWSRTAEQGNASCAHKAYILFQKMTDKWRQTGDERIKPHMRSITAVIQAWVRSGTGKEGALKAESMLDFMLEMYLLTQDKHMRPTEFCFALAMDGWGKSGVNDAPLKAEALLRRMEGMYHSGHTDQMPGVLSYSTLIQVWSKSHLPHKARRAWDLLSEMKEHGTNIKCHNTHHFIPNGCMYGSVINACVHSNAKDALEAVEVATQVMEDVRKSQFAKLDSEGYGNLILVYSTFVEHEGQRLQLIKRAFQHCCLDGELNNSVLALLRKKAPSLYQKLPGKKLQDLPKAWTRSKQRERRSEAKRNQSY